MNKHPSLELGRLLPELPGLRKLQAAFLAAMISLPAYLDLGVRPALAKADSGSTGAAQPFDLSSAYPNFAMVRAGYMLSGYNSLLPGFNPADPVHSGASILRFRDLGDGMFNQFNAPADCHYDAEQWDASSNTLEYLGTFSDCAPTNSMDIEFSPGIAFMPHEISSGDSWELSGVSSTKLYWIGKVACTGTDTWSSRFVGTELLPDGSLIYDFRTDETQTLRPTAKKYTAVCGAGAGDGFKWVETWQLVESLNIQNGTSITGSAPGLFGNKGGKPESFDTPNGTNWNNHFNWSPIPSSIRMAPTAPSSTFPSSAS